MATTNPLQYATAATATHAHASTTAAAATTTATTTTAAAATATRSTRTSWSTGGTWAGRWGSWSTQAYDAKSPAIDNYFKKPQF